jgi:hypothetical protein
LAECTSPATLAAHGTILTDLRQLASPTRWKAAILAGAVLVIVGITVLIVGHLPQQSRRRFHLVQVARTDLGRVAESNGFPDFEVRWAARMRSSGAIVASGRAGRTNVALCLAGDRARVITVPAPETYLDGRGNPVAWRSRDAETVTFRGGSILRVAKSALFGIEQNGRFFVRGDGPSRSYVGEVERPGTPLFTSTTFFGQSLDWQDQKLVVAGYVMRERSTRPAVLVLSLKGDRMKEDRVWVSSRGSGISEPDAGNWVALVWEDGLGPGRLLLWDWSVNRFDSLGATASDSFLVPVPARESERAKARTPR